MNQKGAPFVVNLSILTMITVLVWIGYEVYHVLTGSPSPVVSQSTLEPLPTELDESVINRIQQSVHMTDNEIGDTVLTGPAPAAEPLETPLPEESPSPTSQPDTDEGTAEEVDDE